VQSGIVFQTGIYIIVPVKIYQGVELVGGMLVGGISVGGGLVGGMSVGGMSVGGSVGTLVGGTGVLLGGIGVGGTGVFVGFWVFVGTGMGVLVGGGRGVLLGAAVGVLGIGEFVGKDGGGFGSLGLLVGTRVEVGKRVGVLGAVEVSVGAKVDVEVGVLEENRIGVDPPNGWDTACSVSSEIVFMLLIATSTMLPGSKTIGVDKLGSDKAIAEATHNRLMPRMPAATTPSNPA